MNKSAHKNVFRTSDSITISTAAVALIVHHYYPLHPLAPTYSYVLGFLILAIGWTIILLAKAQFKKYNQPSKPGVATSEIVDKGIYQFSRNPMYVGITLAMIGVGFVLNIGWIVLAAFISAILMNYLLIKPEEKYLENLFGQKYLDYKAKVRRWI